MLAKIEQEFGEKQLSGDKIVINIKNESYVSP